MVHLYRYIIFIIGLCTTQLVSAYGLRFRGAVSPIDQRTSYDVFAHSYPSFRDYFDLEFNIALYSTESVGYILRVKGKDVRGVKRNAINRVVWKNSNSFDK